MTHTNPSRSRQPQGTPVGGQFAAGHRPPAGLSLSEHEGGPDADAEPVSYGLGDLQLLGYPGDEWNGLPQPWLTKQSMEVLAVETARHRSVDEDFALVFRNDETGEWMVDEGAGWEGEGRTYPVAAAKGPGCQDVYQLQGWDFDEPEPWTDEELAEEVDDALPHYLDTAKRTTNLIAENGTDAGVADLEKFHPDAEQVMREDLEDFYRANQDLIRALRTIDPERGSNQYVAQDFSLTRNRHGAGFWDRGLGDIGDLLTDRAHSHGEQDVELGDDGLLHVL